MKGGENMAKSIHPNTVLGHVQLYVSNLKHSIDFYRQILGFKLHRQVRNPCYLGASYDDLLVLTERAESRRVSNRTGLYHFAILVPSRLGVGSIAQIE